ncbi:MAG: radical SAM protein, partial [Chloroflexia bacterium]|nr:radical SAM protein [Chloroflexia bacterium]
MEAYYSYLNELINKNKSAYSAWPQLKWLNTYTALDFQVLRDGLLKLAGSSTLFKGTKPYYRHISKGCNLCGQGLWSCLFITGKCNASCFYCPASQVVDEVPTSQGLSFPTAASYAEYVSYFKYKGVSFSGGEPLLFAHRVIEYLREVRIKCSPDIYTWLYTNGIVATEAIFKRLAEFHLNEVRFDIGATGYNLDKIKYAKGFIPNITIEIPAVPEEKERIKALLPEMIKAGVSNLNLHQLRLTSYNVGKLSKRDYTYIPAEKPIVLESELTALEIINYAHEQNLEIGINYCSFFFKNRFQAVGYRKMIANGLGIPPDRVSSRGFERELNDKEIRYYAIKMADEGTLTENPGLLSLENKKYDFRKDLIYCKQFDNENGCSQTKSIISQEPSEIPSEQNLFEIWMHEYIEKGLR